ncbi:MAG: hypothetical protein GOVbin7759_56 [Prokaryotic dsDNA virus sp.]|jgi:hypothetical protein|nr:MAG: hypothetical protein GOVbin7759_56 [Prokaryotic dsDNA virus sp.]|tara:strand:- start:3941 stop:4636 length:696 start_codon:yes stop_codon:yes gene_type:complete
MAILSAMQSAALRLVGKRPEVFFGASGQFEQEITDLANEVAQDVAQYRDWQALVKVATITGDGTTTEYNLPDDYGRMTQASTIQDLSSWFWGYEHVQDINSFLYLQETGFTATPGSWIIYGDRLRFAPAPDSAQNASYPYITKNYAVDFSTAPKSAFTQDNDTFLLPERLLTLGLVWRWRENKKLDATGDQEAFIKALDEYGSKDGGSSVLRWRSRRAFPGTRVAWPWTLG